MKRVRDEWPIVDLNSVIDLSLESENPSLYDLMRRDRVIESRQLRDRRAEVRSINRDELNGVRRRLDFTFGFAEVQPNHPNLSSFEFLGDSVWKLGTRTIHDRLNRMADEEVDILEEVDDEDVQVDESIVDF